MSCNPETVITSAEIVNAKSNFSTIKTVVEGGELSTITPDGKAIQTLQGALDSCAQGDITTFSAAATYSNVTDWVDVSGIVYRPIPSYLPIGPEAFDSSKWIVAQGGNQRYTVPDYATLAARLSADYYKPGDTITIASTSTPGINGSVVIFDNALAAYTNNGIDIFTGGTLAAVRQHDGMIDMRWGEVLPYPADSGTQQNAVADYCRSSGYGFYAPEGFEFLTTEMVDLRSIRKVRYDSYLRSVTDVITMEIGGDSNSNQQYNDISIHKVQKGGASTPSVRIVGSNKNKIKIHESSYIQVWADNDTSLGGADQNCAYNDIQIYSCTDLELADNASSDDTFQWVNQNTFHLNFIINFTMKGVNQHNGNVFYGGSFEGGTSKIHFQVGRGNTFWNIRGEDDLTVEFDSDTENNLVLTNWVGFANSMDTAKTVINNGSGNGVKNINTVLYENIPLCCINYSSYRTTANSTGNIVGLSQLTADVPNRTLTSGAFAAIYRTPQFPISSVNEVFFSFRVLGKSAGGVRVVVNGYDSSGVAIPSTGADINYTTGSIGDKGFGENNTSATNSAGQSSFYIKNQNAAYLEIQLNAANDGCVFQSIACYARSSDQDSVCELGAFGQVSDV